MVKIEICAMHTLMFVELVRWKGMEISATVGSYVFKSRSASLGKTGIICDQPQTVNMIGIQEHDRHCCQKDAAKALLESTAPFQLWMRNLQRR